MKILLIHQYFLEEDGAGGSRFNEMTRIWSGMGHEITVLAGMMPDQYGKKRPEYQGRRFVFKKHEKVNVWRCYVSSGYNKGNAGRIWGYFSFVLFSLWAGLFKVRGRYDVILCTSPPLFVGISAVMLSWMKRIPYVFEVRDLWPGSVVDTGIITNKFIIKASFALEAFLYRKAKLINVLTPAFRQVLLTKNRVAPGKVIMIPNAADFALSDSLLAEFDPLAFRREKGVEDRFIVTYVGAHGVANALHQLLDTAELLKNTPVVFWLIGQGITKQALIEDVEKRGLKNVVFIKPIPKKEVFRYILASDMGASVLMNNDHFHTIYSNKTFDYMACKKPVLIAIGGVSRELVESADAGIYAEPENAADLADKISRYMNDRELCQRQGENGYRYAKKNFDRMVLAEKYSQTLEQTIVKSTTVKTGN